MLKYLETAGDGRNFVEPTNETGNEDIPASGQTSCLQSQQTE